MATATHPKVVELPKLTPLSRVVFTQGGKGGTGKTAFISLLAEWYASHNLPHTLLDLDTENKSKGSLAAYFPKARKVNIHTPKVSMRLSMRSMKDSPIVIADMGAGAGAVAATLV